MSSKSNLIWIAAYVLTLFSGVYSQPDLTTVGAFGRLKAAGLNTTFPFADYEGVWHSGARMLQTVLEQFWGADSPGAILRYSTSTVSSQCSASLYFWAVSLRERQLWAISMADAAGKLPPGVLLGNLEWTGSFTQCITISADFKVETDNLMAYDVLRGSYCTVVIANLSRTADKRWNPAPTTLRWDLCVPNSCTSSDVQSFISSVLPWDDIRVLASSCVDNTPLGLTTGAIAVICLLSVLGAVIAAATCYDILLSYTLRQSTALPVDVSTISNGARSGHRSRKATLPSLSHDKARAMLNGKQMIPTHSTTLESTPLLPADPHISGPRAQGLASRLLLSFSVLASAKRILNVNPTTSLSTDDGTLHAIHGIRFLSMSWVILGHTWLYIGGKTSNILDVINFVKRFTFQAIVNATVSVDTFFLLSGTLLSYLLLREIKRCNGPSNISWFKFIVHRYLRLSPIYMILAVLLLVLYRYMGSGPFWYTGGYDCEKYWWTYLLYINNIVDLEHMCNGYTWYMANDMQFFLISLGLIALLYKRAVLGVISVLLVATASSVTTGVITYVKNYPAALPGLAAQSNVDSRAWYNDVYWVPWCRIGPYLVGVLLGYLLFRFKCKVRMHWVVVICGWCLAAACNLGVLYGLYDEANGHNASQTVNSLYAATHRTLWAVGVAWVIFACVTGYGGIVNILLSWPGFVPLSRLTYAAYLVQTPLILWVYGNAKSLYHITEISMTILFCGHLVLSYGIAFVVSMAFETPVIGIMKLVLSHRK